MKKVFLNWRYYAMVAIGFVVILGVFSVPEESLPTMKWLLTLLWTKAVGIVAGYMLYKLVKRWEAKNLVPELSKMIEEGV